MRRSLAILAVLLFMAVAPSDPLADVLARLKTRARPDDMALLARADDALQHGRRLLALQRIAVALPVVEATSYALAHAHDDLEREWKRNANVRALTIPDDLQPAALRALAEIAKLEARGYYDASLEYGRATSPQDGLFYLGRALGEKSVIDLLRKNSRREGQVPSPRLRSIANEIDALQRELLALYRPPASIDHHGDFIGASALVKEARELDDAGLRYGATLRYLEAVRRVALLTTTPAATAQPLTLPADVDHSIAQIYVEAAQSEPGTASVVANFVLPRYLATLRPAQVVRTRTAKHTITLVRWPYT